MSTYSSDDPFGDVPDVAASFRERVRDQAPEPEIDEPATYATDELVPTVRWDLLQVRDPDAVAAVARGLREQLRERIDQLAAHAARSRGSVGKPSSSWLLAEAQTLAAAGSVLRSLAAELTGAAREADWRLAEAMDDVLGRKSMKVADEHGGMVEVTLAPPTSKVSVDEEKLLDVLGTWEINQSVDLGSAQGRAYADGVRDGIDALRRLLGSSPGWKSTALAAKVQAMQRTGEGDLAARFDDAWARVDAGDPTPRVKVTYPDEPLNSGPAPADGQA